MGLSRHHEESLEAKREPGPIDSLAQRFSMHTFRTQKSIWLIASVGKDATDGRYETDPRISDQEAGKRRTDFVATAQVVDGDLYRHREQIARQHSWTSTPVHWLAV